MTRATIVLLASLLGSSCSWLESRAKQSSEKTEALEAACKPAPGPAPSQCEEYAQNADWLPPAYVRNAFCACSKTPDVPTANCVRGYLRQKILNAGELKTKWGAEKKKRDQGIDVLAYDAYMVEQITPVIYGWHKEAYAQCCCKGGPAPYDDWIGVTTVDLEDCNLVDAMIDLFGSCDGTPGRW